MRPAYAASFVAALVCHALLLFGFKLDTPASPLALSDEPSSVDVSLVAAAPDSAPAQTQVAPSPSPEPAPPAPEPTPPPPMPGPTPVPQPTPEMSTPPPESSPTPAEETAPAQETPGETPVSRPRPQKHSQKTGHALAPVTMQGETHPGETRQGAAPNGPIGTAVRYRSNPKPDYPEEARRQHEEGFVLLSVEVSAEGRAIDVSLKRSSGFDLLDQAAIQAVRRWTFEPARVASLPITSRVDVPVRFSLSQ